MWGKGAWSAAIGVVLALSGAVAVYAAAPTPHPHGKPSPSPSRAAAPSPTPGAPSATPTPSETPDDGIEAPDGSNPGAGHPCNHGWYVSQAAHKRAGGAYVSSVAKSDLGKNGNCSAPLPQPPG